MKNNVILILLCCISVLFYQCDESGIAPTGSIRFDDMRVGQKSIYAGFSSKTPHSDSDTAYKPTGDTIVLTVVAQDANGFKISEEWLNSRIKTVYYYFKIEGDSLLVRPQPGESVTGSIIFYRKQLSYALKDMNLPVWTANRWTVMENEGIKKSFGKIKSVSILNQKYDNVLAYYDSTAIAWDGNAQIELYTMANGFVCFQFIGYFNPRGTLFYKIP